MINKRDFLKAGTTAVVASTGTAAALAAVRPSLGEQSGLASWRAHVGRQFEVDGHAVVLQAATPKTNRQPGEQFSLSFAGQVPASIGDGLHVLTGQTGEPVALYLARTPGGLRADFCRLQS